ncbi:exonuclease 1 [Malania oleifera]|uniref:exonuclease 1 n=1 Tax=Malania oleifera TaxID=397392 RepID=UPI0025AE5270|nr:exonuclease 1 [Malania oleifera]
MGIQGLLPQLKSIMAPIHIKELAGCSVAVDTYSWLHKAALSCSIQLCKGLPTSRHIDYCMHRVNLLRHYGVKPVLVFDGGLLPMKIEQENKRARVRRENLARAIEHESNGNSAAAFECYQKAVDISPSLAHELIQVLKQENVCYVVAPYEADAQMTFLAVSKQVDAVITEDSDLIPFGCPRIIFKMDKFGQGVEFRYSMLHQNKEINFTGFTKQMLLEMCILSGCDYLQSLPGMGLKRAHALIKKFKSYDKVIKHLRYSIASVPPLYEESFKKAIWTFQHQRVYDPITEDIVHLSDLSDDSGDDLDFLGPLLPQHIAKGIAKGDLDPFTKMLFQGQNVTTGVVLDQAYQLESFKPESERKKLDLPVQKNLLTNYFCFASLEAKRKFRAPQITPKDTNPVNGFSPCEGEYATEKTAASKANCSPVSLLNSENLDNASLSKNSVEDGANPNVFEKLGSPSRDAIEGKMRTDNRKVVVRSSYFQRKSVNEIVDKKKEKLLVENEVAADAVENTIPESTSLEKYCYKGTFMKRKTTQINSIQAENEAAKFVQTDASYPSKNAIDGKMRTDERKAIVSSYFQHKFVDEDIDNKAEKLLVEREIAADANENSQNPIPESSLEKYCFEGKFTKRKTPPINSAQAENKKAKFVQTDASYPSKNDCIADSDDTFMEAKAQEGKFGCDIAHLGNYSDIAEKSMEKFVSVISSFRFSSSGSRASGLRAPLKDVQNYCVNRSTVGMDLSKFAYQPNNRSDSVSRRG